MEKKTGEDPVQANGRVSAEGDTVSPGSNRRPLLFMLVIFGAMIALSLLTQWRSSLDASFHAPKPIAQRQTLAPDFTLPSLTGHPISMADFRGQVVLLNFWATWCPPCREEMPSLEKLYREFRDQGVVILAVSTDQTREPVVTFMDRYHLTFPALWDAKGAVAEHYQVFGLPTTYLIDRRGFIVSAEVGARDWASSGAKALIRTLLAESS